MSFENIVEQLLKLLEETEELKLNDFELIGDQLELHVLPGIANVAFMRSKEQIKQLAAKEKMKPAEWIEVKFPEIENEYKGKIEEITFYKKNGKKVVIGGETEPPFLTFLGKKRNPHRPVVALDVFDDKYSFPKPIKKMYADVYKNQVEWARRAEKFGADLLTFHCLATDPLLQNRPVKEDGKIYEDMLQNTKSPIIIGGSGNKKMDPILFEELGRIAQDDRVMLSSADKEIWEQVVPSAIKYDHNILAWTQMDINDQIKLNKDILGAGVPRDHIVIDPTCATLGYGLEYSYSLYERMRISGLLGDQYLNFPMSGGTTNAWGAREAWMSTKKAPQWGDVFKRGPLWEVATALSMAICGLDLAMMFHPLAAQTFKNIVLEFFAETKKQMPPIEEWVTMKF
ncbi:MAG: CO dehydrogenase/acetyl-CoA synthase subunit delta [Promethearchaeota archaeon]